MTRRLTSFRTTEPEDEGASFFDVAGPLLPEILTLHGKWLGDRPAVICDGETLSWRSFDEETNRVANGLLALGLMKGDAVAVVMENSIEMVEVLFGVMKAGCVSVPLNLAISDDAMAGMIADAGCRAVVASENQRVRLRKICREGAEAGNMHFIALGKDERLWTAYDRWKAAQSIEAPDVRIGPDDIFNIIYSSGTTGRPKGITHTHKTRLDWAYDLSIALRYHGGARTLCTLALYSNISWVMMLCTFLAGGALIVARKFDASAFAEDVETYRATHIALVPVQFRRILDHPGFARDKVSSMQAVMSCGSPLHAELKQQIFDNFACGVIELYGLTEGVITTLAPEAAAGRMSSVGKPLPGTDIKIIGDDDREAAPGAAGEIVSRARFVMPGYHNRPDASREALWLDEKGRAWLRTGDIGRLDEDGFLYIVDRKKDMILSGGQNIYPADIEEVLLTHRDVKGAAVIGVPHADWGEIPFAYIEMHDDKTLASEIVEWLNARIGKRQRIAGAAIVPELPRNPNGKILKRELRDQHKAVPA